MPFFAKEDPADYNCAVVCLRMACASYGIRVSMAELYSRTEAIGPRNFALPWGICLATASLGLYATYVSRQPYGLNDTSRGDVGRCTDLSAGQVQAIEEDQLKRCYDSERIKIAVWRDEYRNLPARVLKARSGVVIPTLWWDTQPHNVVLCELSDAEVVYHDPNKRDGAFVRMAMEEFERRWHDDRTDHDLLIISNEPLEGFA